MSAASIVFVWGAKPRLDRDGDLTLDLRNVPQSLRAEVVELARLHKAELIEYLKGVAPIHATLTHAGYSLPDWTPPSCRVFLAQLREDWPGFRVNGWYSLTMPRSWPPEFADAVQSIYIRSIQDQ